MSRYSKIQKKYHDNSFLEYTGPSHSKGGVKDAGVEYEGGETKYKDFVFSNRLKAAEGSMSEQSKKIFNKYKGKSDMMSRMSRDAELGEVAAINRKLKEAEEMKAAQKQQAQMQGMPQEQPMQEGQAMEMPQMEMPKMALGDFDPTKDMYQNPALGDSLPAVQSVAAELLSTAGNFYTPYKPTPTSPTPTLPEIKMPYENPYRESSMRPLPTPSSASAPSVRKTVSDGFDKAASAVGNAVNAIDESGVINDSTGIAASMAPMMFRTMDAMFDQPEQVPMFQNQQMYNAMDLMNNRVDADAMYAESERQANAGRLSSVSRSAQVNNAMSAGMYANQQAQNQQAALSIDMQNAQFRGQEAQMRAQMGAQDREYRAQQDDLQARTDAASEQRKDAGAQSLFNLVGTNLSQKRYLADALKNKLDIAQMQLATQEKIAQMLNSNAQMSPELVKLLGTAYDSNLTEKERARARQQLKDSGVELGTIIDDNPGKG